MKKPTPVPSPPRTVTRCAVYCRKSSEEGLGQDFNSLDAQRESGEAYIASQKSEGWICSATRYDDGGYSGGSLERPSLKRLMADIEAKRVDAVIIYKLDRLSRSLHDFSHLNDLFERHDVKLVATTQNLSTATSMGRLTLHMMLSFAQFEREIIGERIRDKLAATRRKGKWAGGKPVLGYDVDRSGPSPKLVVNVEEAERTREIFDLYLKLDTLLPVVQELERRGWTNKHWTTKSGIPKGGRPFDRPTLHALLTNPIFAGKTTHYGEVFQGEHPAIVDERTFDRVQKQLDEHGRHRAFIKTDLDGPLLRGILKCSACKCSMVLMRSGNGVRKYKSYVCSRANRFTRAICPTKSVSAIRIEKAVIEQLREIVSDPQLRSEIRAAVRSLRASNAETAPVDIPSHRELDDIVSDFDAVWTAMTPREQVALMNHLVERVDLDGRDDSISITFRDIGTASPEHQPAESIA